MIRLPNKGAKIEQIEPAGQADVVLAANGDRDVGGISVSRIATANGNDGDDGRPPGHEIADGGVDDDSQRQSDRE